MCGPTYRELCATPATYCGLLVICCGPTYRVTPRYAESWDHFGTFDVDSWQVVNYRCVVNNAQGDVEIYREAGSGHTSHAYARTRDSCYSRTSTV